MNLFLPSLRRTACHRLAYALLISSTVFLTPLSAQSPAAPRRSYDALALKACEIGSGGSKVEAQCGFLEVLENPEDKTAAARKIKLHVAVIKASARAAAADPMVYIAGGPGQSGSDSYGGMASGFKRLLEKRDLLVVDQRGTGFSNALNCKNDAQSEAEYRALEKLELTRSALLAEATILTKRFTERCLAEQTADVRFYNTSVAIQDLEQLRIAIGAPQLNLLGFSYGTRVAQQYAKRYPQTTRSLILDGVAPNELILGSEHALNLDAALNQILGRCAADAECKKRFGDPRETLKTLRESLSQSKSRISMADPLDGKLMEMGVNLSPLQTTARFFAYQSETAAMLPIALDEAKAGRSIPMLAISAITQRGLGKSMSRGMELSVICSEDAEFAKFDPADEARLLGGDMILAMQAQCAVWPKGPRPEGFFEPLTGAIPTLIISGEFDPVTPARYGEVVLKNLSNAVHLVAKQQGHINLSRGCIPRLAARFMDSLAPQKLKTACVSKLKAAPFFVDLTGPSP